MRDELRCGVLAGVVDDVDMLCDAVVTHRSLSANTHFVAATAESVPQYVIMMDKEVRRRINSSIIIIIT